jgi:hypothetical protein
MSMMMLSKGSLFVRTRSSINSTSESSSNEGSSLMTTGLSWLLWNIGGSDLTRLDRGAGVLRSSSTSIWSLSCLNVLSQIEHLVLDYGLPEPHPLPR